VGLQLSMPARGPVDVRVFLENAPRDGPASAPSDPSTRQDLPDQGPARRNRTGHERRNSPNADTVDRPSATSPSERAGISEQEPPAARTGTRPQSVEARIHNALHIVAELLQHDDAYLPIFLRLEGELESARAQSAALSRARAYLRRRR
jgi:hypothetical protein